VHIVDEEQTEQFDGQSEQLPLYKYLPVGHDVHTEDEEQAEQFDGQIEQITLFKYLPVGHDEHCTVVDELQVKQ
jgi:hypothetical protein